MFTRIRVPVCWDKSTKNNHDCVFNVLRHVICKLGGWNLEGEHDAYDFGSGAGFYVNAARPPYDQAYNMYSYVTEELHQVLSQDMGDKLDLTRVGLTGHSMGGHGALTMVSGGCVNGCMGGARVNGETTLELLLTA